ncbi:MAG: hypothetical protein IJU23_14215 [Proteobacteria bacterium]|nr:hypothetical protein [Pseudomonadota bacterium]
MKHNNKLLYIFCALGLLAQSCVEYSYDGLTDESDCKTPGFVRCNGICIDPATTSEYCGANTYCEGYKVCNRDQTCQNGKCTTCSGPECQTTTKCIDYSTQCGPTGIPQLCLSGTWLDQTPCNHGLTCLKGVCTEVSEQPQACSPQGYVRCNGACVDPMSVSEYCGADANCEGYVACAKNESCQSGKCKPFTCPDGQHMYQGTCEPDSVKHCGEHDYHCANEVPGWQNGECSKGQCSATECASSFHLYNHTCEINTQENCGEHNLDCRISMTGFLNGQCINRNCVATECIQGYHTYLNVCEPDDENHCGNHTTKCAELIQGYRTGECVEGECRVQTCVDGFHLDTANNRCVVDTNDCCGASCSQCTSPRICSKGSCQAQCEAPLSKCNNECHNYANDISHCGGCNQICSQSTVSNSIAVTCTNSICKATSCRSGYHDYDGKCEKDTIENCGTHGTKCNIANATNTCSGGKCNFTCNSNYHTYNNICEEDSTANCGAHGTNCNIDNATNTICSEGICRATACKSKYHVYSNVCEADSTTHCGKHSNACANGQICIAGNCVFPSLNIGDIITFGHYEQDNDTSNGKEPIEWRVLDLNNDGQFLIISDKVLDSKPYNTTYINITWEMSTIRSWLNGYGSSYNTVGTSYMSDNFIDTAFTDDEKAKIIASNVPAHTNPHYSSTPAGNETTDKIFLLSVVETENYFKTDEAREAYATLYAVSNNVFAKNSSKMCTVDNYVLNKCVANYWLRSPGLYSFRTAIVDSIGDVSNNSVSIDSIGIRPALWVNW